MAEIKQLVVLRRKAGLTRKEFFDYHFQIHGAISTAPSPLETPLKYFQTHITDSAYHASGPNPCLNAHPSWGFHDDVTELYFESEDHLQRVFQSSWVKEKVGPDGANFSDFGSVVPMFVTERAVPLPWAMTLVEIDSMRNSYVAMYFIATEGKSSGVDELTSSFLQSIQRHASTNVRSIFANTPAEVSFDIGKYFGGGGATQFDVVLTVHLNGPQSVPAIRKVQADFEGNKAHCIDLQRCWIAFGERAVVLDQTKKLQFDAARQPFAPNQNL